MNTITHLIKIFSPAAIAAGTTQSSVLTGPSGLQRRHARGHVVVLLTRYG
jgi:hypothetical protein